MLVRPTPTWTSLGLVSTMQCAAVRIHRVAITEPPQMCPSVPSPYSLSWTEAMNGNCPSSAW